LIVLVKANGRCLIWWRAGVRGNRWAAFPNGGTQQGTAKSFDTRACSERDELRDAIYSTPY